MLAPLRRSIHEICVPATKTHHHRLSKVVHADAWLTLALIIVVRHSAKWMMLRRVDDYATFAHRKPTHSLPTASDPHMPPPPAVHHITTYNICASIVCVYSFVPTRASAPFSLWPAITFGIRWIFCSDPNDGAVVSVGWPQYRWWHAALAGSEPYANERVFSGRTYSPHHVRRNVCG